MISNAGYLTDMAKDSSENALKVFPFVFLKFLTPWQKKCNKLIMCKKKKSLKNHTKGVCGSANKKEKKKFATHINQVL